MGRSGDTVPAFFDRGRSDRPPACTKAAKLKYLACIRAQVLFSRNWLTVFLAADGSCFPAPPAAIFTCTTYYPGWTQDSMPAASIDFTALSRIVHFALVPNADGSLNRDANDITPGNVADSPRRRMPPTKVLICVGGAASQSWIFKLRPRPQTLIEVHQ